MKTILILLLITSGFLLFSQNLQLTADGQVFQVESAPGEHWLVVKNSNQYQIYEENFNFVTSFDLGAAQNSVQWIYGAATDFDDDDNIEVLYQANIGGNYSVFLRDIVTDEIQLQFDGTSDYWYYCFSFGYLGNERIFAVSRYNLTNYSYDVSYVYRSGNPVSAVEEIPQKFLQNFHNFPNPFSAQTNTIISFDLENPAKVNLNIFNAKGQKVKNLLTNQSLPKGKQQFFWNGFDDAGKPLAIGIYFLKLENESGIMLRKTVFLK